jgi:3-oxoacyl-[acyl-carrier protein] reductase
MDDDWDNQMEVAVNSHYIMVRGFYSLIPNGSRIIFTVSQMSVHPHATVQSYGVTKPAVCALAKNLVKEFEDSYGKCHCSMFCGSPMAERIAKRN